MFFQFISYQWEELHYRYLPSSCAGCHAEGQESTRDLTSIKMFREYFPVKIHQSTPWKLGLGVKLGIPPWAGLRATIRLCTEQFEASKTPSPGNPRAFVGAIGEFKPCLGGVGSLERKCLVLLAHYTCEVLIRIYFTNSVMLCTALSI